MNELGNELGNEPGPDKSAAKDLEDRFYLKFVRIMRIAKLMQARHFPASTAVIAADFAAIYGCGYVERTINRDLQFLNDLGVLERERRTNVGRTASIFWKWKSSANLFPLVGNEEEQPCC